MASESITTRMMRAARLDTAFYNEVEADTSLTQEALTVVIIAAVATGIGSLGASLIGGRGFGAAILALVVGIVLAIVGYYIWAYVTYFVGTRVFNGIAEPGELLRTLGYAYAPNVLGIFNLIPCAGGLIALVGAIWSLVAGIIAVREALDFDTGKAVLTVIIGWIAILLVNLAIGAVIGISVVGLSAVTGGLGG